MFFHVFFHFLLFVSVICPSWITAPAPGSVTDRKRCWSLAAEQPGQDQGFFGGRSFCARPPTTASQRACCTCRTTTPTSGRHYACSCVACHNQTENLHCAGAVIGADIEPSILHWSFCPLDALGVTRTTPLYARCDYMRTTPLSAATRLKPSSPKLGTAGW